jgi:DNA (cytosine-5)-methyltransferase 1
MDLSKLSKAELLIKCDELGLTKVKSKTKPELIGLIQNAQKTKNVVEGICIIKEHKDEGNEEDESDLESESDLEEDNGVLIEGADASADITAANSPPPNLSGYKFIDLFCGIGGFHQALHKMGATCVLACDIDKECRVVYKDNYGIEPVSNVKDIDEKTMDDFDILCAGFPCFVAGTQTLTNNGYKNIEDVELTDKLLTHTGKFQNIVNLQRKIYNGDLFDLKIKYHPELITATEEHPFYVREQKKVWNTSLQKYDYVYGVPEWKTASKLSINDYYGMVINDKQIIPEFTFEKIINQHKTEQINIKLDNLDYWFVMGYLVGDGWVEETCKSDGRSMHKIRFAINNKDENEIFERINRVIPITDKKSDTGKCKKFGCADFVWFNILKKFGKYAHGKLIPEWVHDAPKEFIQEFINGYMKADGCIRNNVLQITTVSQNLAYGLQRLYLKLGHIFSINKCIRPKTCVIEGRTVNQKDTYCIRGVLQRERNVSSFIEGNYVWYAPFKITKRETSQTPVYNFEVETDNSYVVENVCVHNCQAFSNGGKKKCFDDERGLLFDEIVRIARAKQPRYMFLENVKHILKVSNGEVIAYIKSKIASIGYKLQLFQISPHNFGIPQQRERVYFVCVRNDIYNGTDVVLPTYLGKMEFQKFLDKKEDIHEKYFIKGDISNVLEAWDEMVKQFDVGEKISPTIMMNDAFKTYTPSEFDAFPVWKKDYITKNKPLIEKYRPQFAEWYKRHFEVLKKREIYAKLEWQTGPIKHNDSIFNHFIQMRQSGIRVKKGQYFPTLVAISQIPIYGKEKRYITPRECARLQSFPESFKLSPDDKKSYKQLGNSVNVDNVFTVISSTLKKYI